MLTPQLLNFVMTANNFNETSCRICGEWHDERICPERKLKPMKCAIQWEDDKPSILLVYDSLEEAGKALEEKQKKIEHDMEQWKQEARQAIRGALVNDDILDWVYRGGGVLALSDLMRKHSAIVSLRAAMKHWEL